MVDCLRAAVRLEDASACPWADWLDDELDMPCEYPVHRLEGHILMRACWKLPLCLSGARLVLVGSCGCAAPASNFPTGEFVRRWMQAALLPHSRMHGLVSLDPFHPTQRIGQCRVKIKLTLVENRVSIHSSFIQSSTPC